MEVIDLSGPLPISKKSHMEPEVSKKRRFFTEDSPEKLVDQENATTALSPQGDNPETAAQNKATATTSGFDADLLESLVGEKLEQDVIQRLRELSGDNIERGRILRDTGKKAWLTLLSYQPLPRWNLEDRQAG